MGEAFGLHRGVPNALNHLQRCTHSLGRPSRPQAVVVREGSCAVWR